MTREEFDRQWENIDIVQGCSIGYNCSQTDNIVDAYVATLEARIAELEALQASTNCIGCRYHNILLEFKPCDMCCNSHDNLYEPKD
jgi:hypothetical protein